VLLALSAQASPAQTAPTEGSAQTWNAEEHVRLDLEIQRAVGEQPLASGQRVYAMELLYADITISFEKNFLEQRIVPLWRMPLDLQVELSTPWAEESTSWFADSPPLEEGTSLVLDRNKGFVKRLPDQQDGWVRFHLRQKLIVTNPGEWQLPAAQLRFAWATRFEDDLVRGAIPLDRQETTIQSEAWQAHTVEPPHAGRPKDFMGSVGRYTMKLDSKLASEQPGSPEQETLQVRIAFRGEGYLNPLFAWSPDFGSAFTNRGAFLEMHPEGLTWVGEVQTSHPGFELPSVSWSYFDPTDGGHYKTLRTPGAEDFDVVLHTGRLPWVIGGGVLFVIGMLYLQRRRVPAIQTADSTAQSRSKTGAPKLALSSAPTPPLSSVKSRRAAPVPQPSLPGNAPRDLMDHLAVFLDCPRDQIYADDLHERLCLTKVSAAFAKELTVAVQALLQARYAEQGVAPSEQHLAELIQKLGKV
jgi:hypothetical protein